MGAPPRKYDLISRAIAEAKSTDTGKVSLQLEKILHEEMLAWPSYAKLSPKSQYNTLCGRLERMQIYTISDIRKLVDEVTRARKQEFKRALGM